MISPPVFFAGATPDAPTRTYTFGEICHTLNDVANADWPRLLTTWLEAHGELDTNAGLTSHGWQLAFADTPIAAFRASEEEAGVSDLSYSIGLTAAASGTVQSISWNGPAFRSGLRRGGRITAVNGEPYSPEALLAAVRAATTHRVLLTVDQDGRSADHALPYEGTLRYPKLERIKGAADYLTVLVQPR